MPSPLAWADHRIFKAPGNDVVFGVDEASLFSVTPDALETLRSWRSTWPVVLDRVPQPDREVLEGLRDARILRPATVGPARALRPDPGEVPLGTLVLEVAQACNLRCTYCYAEGGTYGGPPRLLEPEMARRAVRHLLDHSGDRDSVTLIFFGGEPLLNPDAVRAATEEARTRGRQAGKRVHLSLTTNGTLLDADTVEFLRANRVAVAVSLDGPAHVHDRNRPDATGRGTYDAIVARVRPLLERSPVPVGARVTLPPDQWGEVVGVFDHLIGLGFHEVGIAPASPVTAELLPTEAQQAALLEGFRSLAERFVADARRDRMLPFANILDLVARLHVGQTKSVSCGAGYGYLAVDAGGNLFPCHRLAGEASFCVGSLDRGVEPGRVRSCLGSLDQGRQDGCSRCWARTLCAGGCHYENHLRENLLGLPRGTLCEFIRGWLQVGIETYAQLRAGGAASRLGRRLTRRAQC